MVHCKKLILTLITVLVCYGFYKNLWILGKERPRTRKTQFPMSAAECMDLKSYILNSTMKKFEVNFSGTFLKMMNALQGCPWIENRTERNLLQSQLNNCCNASYSMIVTQENSPVGHTIHYDAEMKVQKVTESLYDMFPKSTPFRKPIRSCAVVGNGGILKNSFCGAEIDLADFVFRLNLPPLNVTDDVGTKTDLVSANPTILIDRFGSLREKRKPFINMMRAFGSALVLMPAFSYLFCTDISIRTLYTLEDFDMSSRVVFFNPHYIANLTLYWRNMKLQFGRMSSGLMLASAAIEICEKVTLYGFWPFSQDLNGTSVPHHYYDNVPPNKGAHSMPDEFFRYVQMHSKGSLQLKLGPC
ncbi:alpha-2,8-sialyltransferase 8F-like [Pseudophryne corroboree]|uniref:alpha-2,8-sialyltransferase 8F-like n=1 Tax=Pseudophryne corroboree TaxID=495146 RepID=UPI0030815DAA